MALLDSLFSKRTAKQVIGDAGEDAALLYLQKRGLALVERNFRCKGGEIDLVMQDKGALVFVEVRARADKRHGGAAASITSRKQGRLILAAQTFLQRYREPPPCRFDVIAIDDNEMTWLVNALEM